MTDLEKEITETEATEKETLDELAELDADLDEVEELLEDEDWDDDAEEIPLCRTAGTKKKLLLFAGIVLGIAAAATAIAIALSKKNK